MVESKDPITRRAQRRKRAKTALAHRFLDVIEYYGKENFHELANLLNTNTNTFNRTLNNAGYPSSKFLFPFLKLFNEVSADWFLFGKGEMLASGKDGLDELLDDTKKSFSQPEVIKYEIKMRDQRIKHLEETNELLKQQMELLKQR